MHAISSLILVQNKMNIDEAGELLRRIPFPRVSENLQFIAKIFTLCHKQILCELRL